LNSKTASEQPLLPSPKRTLLVCLLQRGPCWSKKEDLVGPIDYHRLTFFDKK
jgi:hypothetical protein